MTEIERVETELAIDMVESLADMIGAAIEKSNGEYDLDDIADLIRDGYMYMLVATKEHKIMAVFLTEVIQYPRKTAIRLSLGAGEGMDEWAKPLYETMVAGAQNIGAELIEVQGRPGWGRFLKQFGCEDKYHIVTKEVA